MLHVSWAHCLDWGLWRSPLFWALNSTCTMELVTQGCSCIWFCYSVWLWRNSVHTNPSFGHRFNILYFLFLKAGSRTWTSPNQRYVQPSNVSKSTTWSRDNSQTSYAQHSDFHDNRNRHYNSGSSAGSFSTQNQNRYSNLPSQDFSKDTHSDKDGSLLWVTWLFILFVGAHELFYFC